MVPDRGSGRATEADLTPQPPPSYRVPRPERRKARSIGRDGLHPSDLRFRRGMKGGRVVRDANLRFDTAKPAA